MRTLTVKKFRKDTKRFSWYKVLLDDEDYLKVKELSVFIWEGKPPASKMQYAVVDINGKNIKLHRHLTDCPEGVFVDHINHNTLDNRKCNLRFCTRQQNLMNKKATSRFGYKGIRPLRGTRDRWGAQIKFNKKYIWGGSFSTPVEAAKRYDEMAKEYFGEFACLNFPLDTTSDT